MTLSRCFHQDEFWRPFLHKRPKPERQSNRFAGKHICYGKLSKTRKEIEQLIKDAGGIVASGVSKNTDVLVVGGRWIQAG